MFSPRSTDDAAAKEDFFAEVCIYLQYQTDQQAPIVNLNSPFRGGDNDGIRSSWAALRRLCKGSIMMRSVLSERPDMFVVSVENNQHIVSLTPSRPSAPKKRRAGGHFRSHASEGDKNTPCRFFALGTCQEGDACAFYHETDPELAPGGEKSKKLEAELARAICNVIKGFDGEVKVTFIGNDHHVGRLRKEPQLRHIKLIDFIKQYEEVFKIVPDPQLPSQYLISIQPGGELALPDAEEYLRKEMTAIDWLLPTRIDEPQTEIMKMQALRIDLLHALSSREGRCLIQEIGQDPRVQRSKEKIWKDKHLSKFLKMFPMNFTIEGEEHGHTNAAVGIYDYDVSDVTMLNAIIKRKEGPKVVPFLLDCDFSTNAVAKAPLEAINQPRVIPFLRRPNEI